MTARLALKQSPFIFDPFGFGGVDASEPDVIVENPSSAGNSELEFNHLNRFVQVINVNNLIMSASGTLDILLRRASDQTYETGASAYIISRQDLNTSSVITAAKIALFLQSGAPDTVQMIMEVTNAGLAVPTGISLMLWLTTNNTETRSYHVLMDNIDLHDRIKFTPESGTISGEIIMTRQQ